MIENIAPFIGLGMLTLFVASMILGFHFSEKLKKQERKSHNRKK